MNKNAKIVIIIVIFYVLLAGLIFVFIKGKVNNDSKNSGKDNSVVEDKKNDIIVFNNNTVIKYEEKTIKKTTTTDYFNKLLKVYDGNIYVGDRYISYNDNWYIYDKERNFYDLKDNLLAYIGDYPLSIKKIEVSVTNESDKIRINNYLTKENLNYNYDNLETEKYIVDIDNDNQVESIIAISNSSTLDEIVYGDTFYIVIAIDDNNTNVIYKKVLEDNGNISCYPYLENVFTIDGKNVINLGCLHSSTSVVDNYLYENNNNDYKLLIKVLGD